MMTSKTENLQSQSPEENSCHRRLLRGGGRSPACLYSLCSLHPAPEIISCKGRPFCIKHVYYSILRKFLSMLCKRQRVPRNPQYFSRTDGWVGSFGTLCFMFMVAIFPRLATNGRFRVIRIVKNICIFGGYDTT